MKQFLYLILIVVIGFIVYSNSLNGKFVWDDVLLVRDNAYIKNWSYISKIFIKDIVAGAGIKSNFYRPLQILTYMLDYSIWKLNVAGYHLTNTLLHILAALCIYWLIDILCNDKFLSFLTSILFLVHPIHTEAVSYISGRADSLAVIFMLTCFILYIKGLELKSSKLYILTLLSYILALLSRENVLIFPLLLLLYYYAFKKKVQFKKFLPILGIAFIYILLRLTVLSSSLPHLYCHTTLSQRLPGFFVAITDYLQLLLLPFNLHMEYGGRLFHFSDPKAILGVAISFSLIIYAFLRRNKNGLIFFSVFWFFIALLPVSNLYPLIIAYMAEHWLYVPSIGFFLILAKSLSSLYRTKKFRAFAVVLIVGLLALYSILTIKQNATWREPIAFYERTLKYAPDSVRTLTSLGRAYRAIGKNEEAIVLFKKAIEIDPTYAYAYNSLGVAYLSTSKNEEAIVLFKKALQINPYFEEAYNNLGNEYLNIGKHEEAIALYKKALKLNPNYADIHCNLAMAYYCVKRYELAIEHCDRAISLGHKVDPKFLEALKPYRK